MSSKENIDSENKQISENETSAEKDEIKNETPDSSQNQGGASSASASDAPEGDAPAKPKRARKGEPRAKKNSGEEKASASTPETKGESAAPDSPDEEGGEITAEDIAKMLLEAAKKGVIDPPPSPDSDTPAEEDSPAHEPGKRSERERKRYPLLVLRGVISYPHIPLKLELDEEEDVRACLAAGKSGKRIFLLPLRAPAKDENERNYYASVGILASMRIVEREEREGSSLPVLRVSLQGLRRARPGRIFHTRECEEIETLPAREERAAMTSELTPRLDEAKERFKEFVRHIENFPAELKKTILGEQNVGLFCDAVAATVLVGHSHKIDILEELDPGKRLHLLCDFLEEEMAVLQEEAGIHREVRRRLDANQRDYYLREQMRVIREELGEEDDEESAEYREKVLAAKFPQEVEQRLLKEVDKLAKMPYSSAESSVQRSYLDVCLEIPFGKSETKKIDLARAEKILNRDHYGMEKVKERVMEFLAVRCLKPDMHGQILCLVGPPGVGKTSIAASLAEAMGRKYVRVSLGGVHDEADIRGHRRTYVASMPGRIVDALVQAKCSNPLILLDEVDKLGNDFRGDPTSALLEVLDGEQNKAFRDHFVEIPIDLSDCIFVATANSLENVSPPLVDRMEVIELPLYNRREKLEIAVRHLLPKQKKRHGIEKTRLKVSREAILQIIDAYTAEAGVRNLERQLAKICRKAAGRILAGEEVVRVTPTNLKDFLGEEKITPEKIYDADPVGIVNGMAYNGVGGDLLRVEAVAMPGTGKLELTGSLGDVIKESAHIALSYIRMHAGELGIDPSFYKDKDIHIHFPEGATPKDGPSAGVAVATALASELSGRPTRRELSMTGEITLHGKVLPIGGLKEKTMAAYRAGVTTILLPEENRKDVEEEVDVSVRQGVDLRFVRSLDEVFADALLPPRAGQSTLPSARG